MFVAFVAVCRHFLPCVSPFAPSSARHHLAMSKIEPMNGPAGSTREGAEALRSIEAVAHVMLHLEETTFELPELEGGLESDVHGDWSEPVSFKDDT